MPQDPLSELLQRIARGEPRTLTDLARDMAVSSDLVEMMLADLQRGGYLVSLETACEGGCARCAHNDQCGIHFAGKLWALTEKGSRHLAS